MLTKVKQALRVTTNAYDAELTMLINAARVDMGIAGIEVIDDDICNLGIILFCKLHFGTRDDVDRLKQSYDEIKKQLGMATGYTNWGGADD